MKLRLPAQVERAIALLQSAGREAYVVGGAVRDAVLGAEVHDWDLTTSALPEELVQIFCRYPVAETGLRHGTLTVLLDGLPLEITTYRTDGTYTDHRRPDTVCFTRSLREDLARRDFTVNAMAYAPGSGLTDPFGGREDLARGVLRCVGDPERRFREDALRILRGLRFASVLGLEPEENTERALRRCGPLLRAVAAERVRTELTGLLLGEQVERVLLEYADVAAVPIPELEPMFGLDQHNFHHDRDLWRHTAAVTAAAPRTPVLRWAALLHDVGKPACFSLDENGVGHFYGHAAKSAELADQILTRLRFDNAGRKRFLTLIRYHDLPLQAEAKQLRRLLNRLGPETVRDLIALHRADTVGLAPAFQERLGELDRVEALLDELLRARTCFSLRDLAIRGEDLLAMGLRGREVGETLQACLTAVLEERLPNRREELLAFAGALREDLEDRE